MEQKISAEKINFVKEYINRLENEFAIYEDNLEFNFQEIINSPCYLKVIYTDDSYEIFNLKFR